MTTHIMAMTYGPKIEPIQLGDCRQTTRIFNPNNPFEVDDFLLIHGWSGKPYRSPWNWRRPKEPITQVIDMMANKINTIFWQNPITGKPFSNESLPLLNLTWADRTLDELARLDGIVPATGLEYRNVLEGFHGPFTSEPVHFQIIRW